MRHALFLARRWRLARKGFDEPFAGLLRSEVPGPVTLIDDVEFVALDIETTGLDAATADMLSVGWVLVRAGKIAVDTATSIVVQPSGEVGDSASVHGLTDTVVRSGQHWGLALDRVIEILTGRVLLVHHAGLDKALLDRMCLQRYGAKLPVQAVDTMAIELRRQQRKHHVESGSSLRLGDLRDAYGLPRYAAHDCLVDALATAELLLAIVAHDRKSKLGELLG